MSGPVRIFIAGARRLVVEALEHVFAVEPSFVVVGSSTEIDSAAIAALRPDVTIVDCDDIDCLLEEAIEACGRGAPQARICVLSSQHRARLMQRALGAKADAFVVKDTAPATLIEIVHTIVRGEFYADPRLAGAMLRRRSTRSHDTSDLSGREYEIVRLIAEGLSNREIGQRLTLSEKTVKNHVSHILAKLKVAARSGVAVYAVRNGLVS